MANCHYSIQEGEATLACTAEGTIQTTRPVVWPNGMRGMVYDYWCPAHGPTREMEAMEGWVPPDEAEAMRRASFDAGVQAGHDDFIR